jgi:hypothetical protein
MEIKALDFFLGVALGAGLGVGLTWAVIRVRGWLGYSEAGRLREENRTLRKRLAEKDRHIGRMLSETERLAEKLGEKKIRSGEELKSDIVLDIIRRSGGEITLGALQRKLSGRRIALTPETLELIFQRLEKIGSIKREVVQRYEGKRAATVLTINENIQNLKQNEP